MIKNSYTQTEIARTIGKDKSVISREIKRNRDKRNGKYKAELAQKKYEEHKKEKPRKRFTDR